MRLAAAIRENMRCMGQHSTLLPVLHSRVVLHK
jgi:hypothetical protein